MLKLIQAFWNICLFKLRPQDLPSSTALVGFSIALYIVITTLGAALSLSPFVAILAATVDAGLLILLTYLILWSKELTARFNQTITALAGSYAVLTFIALPLLAWQMQSQEFHPIRELMLLCLMMWSLSIVGHILRHAMNIHILMGMVLAVVYVYVSISVSQSLFMAPAPS